ncbi:MAG: decaprenyl-phosphate phosphoribosyltransferase [Fimbriimonadaceae bacterium]
MSLAVVRLLRPKQWTKGLLVFAAPLFTRRLTDPIDLKKELVAFFAIALLSSAVYILNDACDVERDRRHPTKRQRPLASGAVSLVVASSLGVLLALIGFGMSVYLGRSAIVLVGVYVGLQVAYNVALKHVAVADVFLLASGYVLRAALGAAAIHVAISGWLLFCTGSLALLVGIGKRRSEFQLQVETGIETREALSNYSLQGLDLMLTVAAAAAMMSYGIYSIESPTGRQYPALLLTCLWVSYAIFRYVYLVVVKGEGGEPETLLFRDPHILVSVTLFVVTAALAMQNVIPTRILDNR